MMGRAVVWRGALFTALWWVLSEGRGDGWAVGLASILLALATSLIFLPPAPIRISPSGLAGFIGFFLRQSVIGGAQVALLAMRRRLDLRPAIIEIPLRLPEGPARILLANTLSLLPGTLSVGLVEERLRLHVLDARLPARPAVRVAEARIARMLGLTWEAT